MKIGIISMQRIVNCGSFLQAYALKKIIEDLGHEVIFIDYTVEKPLLRNQEDKKIYYKNKFKKNMLDLMSCCPSVFSIVPFEIRYSLQERYNYKRNYFKYIGLSQKKQYHTQVDTLVIGSDEVFNCLQINPEVGYSLELFGKNSNSKKIISYAASFGNTTYDEIKKAGIENELRFYLNKMETLSVRDDNSVNLIKKISGRISDYHLDPVLIYGFEKEIKELPIKDNFILVYAYRQRIRPNEVTAIQNFAKENKCKIISVGGFQTFCDENILATPFEILGYFKKAKYIFTDTFHGTIFSVINHKQFVTFVREGHGTTYGNSEKMSSLLNKLGLEERKVMSVKMLSEVAKSPIDYFKVDRILNEERRRARDYLSENL